MTKLILWIVISTCMTFIVVAIITFSLIMNERSKTEIIQSEPNALSPEDSDKISKVVEPTQFIEDKDIVVNFRIEKNGKEVTIYRESENTLVYTFGVPGQEPELEYRGPILAKVEVTGDYWGDSVNNLETLFSAVTDHGYSWSIKKGESSTIIEAANSQDSNGFIHVYVTSRIIYQEVYIFRTSGWEYTVLYKEEYSFDPQSDIDDERITHDSTHYEIAVLSPDGKMYRLR